MRKNQRCPACEQGRLIAVPSVAPMPFRHVPSLIPAWPVPVPTCEACGERFIDDATGKALDEALESALARKQHELLLGAIASLCTERTQRDWEKRLAISPGYLSRLKAGKESSVALTTCLVLLAQSPATAWDRVGQVWAPPASAPARAPAPVFVMRHLTLVTASAVEAPVTGMLHELEPRLASTATTEAA